MFDITWCSKYDFSVLYPLHFMSSLISGEHLPHLLLQKINICHLLQNVFLQLFQDL